MLKRALRYIRQKPKAVRDQYALGIAASLAGLLLVGWIVSFDDRYTDTSDTIVQETTTSAETVEQTASIGSFLEQIRTQVSDLTQPTPPPISVPTATITLPVSTLPPTPAVTPVPVRIATYTATTTD